jgi:hypothetical protein
MHMSGHLDTAEYRPPPRDERLKVGKPPSTDLKLGRESPLSGHPALHKKSRSCNAGISKMELMRARSRFLRPAQNSDRFCDAG